MSKLEELIKELCPDGVKYTTVGDLIIRETKKAKDYPNIKRVYAVSKDYGIIDSLEYWNGTVSDNKTDTQIFSSDTSNYNVIEKGMFAYNPARLNIGSINYLKTNEAGLLSPMYIVFSIKDNLVLQEYLFLQIKSSKIMFQIDSMKEEGARFRFDFKNWKKIKIPLPPIEIQREIVRVLDEFTLLSAELAAELAARKKQYNFYRDRLLTFNSECVIRNAELGEVCKGIFSGKNNSRVEDGKYIVYGSTGAIAKTDSYVYDKPHILVARVGANAGYVYIAEGCYDVSDNTLIIDLKEHINLKYIYYILQKENIHKYAKGGGQPLITAGQLKSLKIKLPPLEIQERIVNVLDNFDAICSDLKIGLPAEIEKRQQQYEYYRDKLLTFDYASATISKTDKQTNRQTDRQNRTEG